MLGQSFSFTDKSLIVVRGSLAGHLGAEPLGPKTYNRVSGPMFGSFRTCSKIAKSHCPHFFGKEKVICCQPETIPSCLWEAKHTLEKSVLHCSLTFWQCYQNGSRMLSDANQVANVIRCESSRIHLGFYKQWLPTEIRRQTQRGKSI